MGRAQVSSASVLRVKKGVCTTAPTNMYAVTQHRSNRSFRVVPSGSGLLKDTISRGYRSSGLFASARRLRAEEANRSQ